MTYRIYVIIMITLLTNCLHMKTITGLYQFWIIWTFSAMKQGFSSFYVFKRLQKSRRFSIRLYFFLCVYHLRTFDWINLNQRSLFFIWKLDHGVVVPFQLEPVLRVRCFLLRFCILLSTMHKLYIYIYILINSNYQRLFVMLI